MKAIRAVLGRAKGRLTGLAVLAAALVIPAGLLAWGPDRPTYTLEEPADHVTFNSITNNKKHGDERNFVQIREAGVGNYGEEVQIQPGKEYEVYVFFHNNAKSKLNSAEHDHKGVARNAQMRVQMPATVKQGEKARITGVVSADNAQPQQVWDEAYGVGSADMALRYVPNSAKITSLGAVNGQTMPDSLLTTGAPLGYDKLDGNLPGCNEFSGFVIFRFKAVQPNFEVVKEVSKANQNSYSKSVAVKKGETVEYKIQYKNTGSVQQDNVVIKDTLPKGVSYIPGSTQVATSKTNGQWEKITDDSVIGKGINIGSYAPGGNAYVKFSAKVDKLSELDCGPNKLTNTAEARTDNGNKSDTADVTVDNECEVEKPVYTCDALAVNRLGDNRYKFETGYTVKGGEFKSVVYIVRDASGKEIARVNGTPNAAEYTQATPGRYTVEAVVTFTVDGRDVTASGDNCKKAFDVPQAPAPGEIEVCRLSDKKIVTIKENEFDASKHSKNYADCAEKPATPVTPATPATPAELPQTGGFDTLSIVGLGALALSASYYIASRRTLG